MQVEPLTLTGQVVRLEPLGRQHASGLLEQFTPEIFRYIATQPQAATREAVEVYIDQIVAAPDSCPFAVIAPATGAAVGVTTYMDIRPEHRGLEIGNTWLGVAHQGTRVNPEMKYLMLAHAFETLGAIRVQLKTDLRNERSQNAIAKLGARREGVLRKHILMPDGHQRDTVMYSITDEEWPRVKAGLEARLAR